MKNLIYTAALLILLTSCDKQLDQSPSDSVPQDDVFSTDASVKKALNGAYDVMTGDYLLNGDLQLYSELLAADGEIRWTGTYNQPREIFEKKILTNNSYITGTWEYAYKAINICNNIIAAINVVNTADQDRVKGEALFIRGEMYFELARFFSKPYSAGNAGTNPGAQIVTAPTRAAITDSNYVPRSSLADTYAFILNDLKTAKSLLPQKNGAYANTFTAAAVLSRVYLQMADYANARDEANYVIETSSYDLTDDYAGAFNNEENSSEDIFAVQISEQDGSNDMNLFWSIPVYGGRSGDVDILQKHLDLYEANDDRLALFYLDNQHVYRCGKWKLKLKINLPLIRLAEMYVTRAECNLRLGTSTGASAFDDIKKIRARAGLSTSMSYITLNNILLERKLELAFEGERIHDVKRLKESVDGYAYDANELVLPIPIREINTVGADILQQNDGY